MPQVNHNIVGNVSYTVGSGGKLILQSGWESANIGTVLIPQLKGVPTYEGQKFSGNVRFFKPAIPQLVAAFAEVGRLGLADKILFWDGSFVPRLIREGNTPSNHSFGTAFDINADWNPFKKPPAAVGAKGDLHAIAAIFKRFGFTWGGDWKNSPDGMHFEVNRILSPSELSILTQNQSAYPTQGIKQVGTIVSGFDVVVLNTGNNVGAGLMVDGDLYVPARATLREVGRDVVRVGDYRARKEQPRFYIEIGDKAK